MTLDLIKALRKLARPVLMASTKYRERLYGFTVSSVAFLSIVPPSLLVCINKDSSVAADIFIGSYLNINFLSSAQTEITELCGFKEDVAKRFNNNFWITHSNGTLLALLRMFWRALWSLKAGNFLKSSR